MKRILALLLTLAALGAHAQFQIWTKSGGTATSVAPSAYPLLAPDGSVGAPSYGFSSQTNTGMFYNSSTLDWAIAGGHHMLLNTSGLRLFDTDMLSWGGAGVTGTQDVLIGRDAANTLALRNGTNGQIFNVYNTFTNASNFERGFAGWASNVFLVGTDFGGTGATRALGFYTNGNQRWKVDTTGHFIAVTDNSYDIGATGGTRPRSIYTATSFIGPLFQSDSAKVLIRGTGTGATQLAATQTTVPTVTTNGGTSPACVGSDTAMICTEGTSPPAAATFTVTFNGTWAAAPSCVALRGTAGATPLVQNVVTTTTTVQVNLSANLVASEKYHIHCMGVS